MLSKRQIKRAKYKKFSPQDARDYAFLGLWRVYVDEAYSHLVWDQILSESNLAPAEKGQATQFFYGTLERTIELDEVLSQYSKPALSRLDAAVLIILRLGAYQVLYSQSPAYAVVDESVAKLRHLGFHSATGFANAILRKISKLTNYSPQSLAAKTNLNEDILQVLKKTLGAEEEILDFSRALVAEQYLSLRLRQVSEQSSAEKLQQKQEEISQQLKEQGFIVQPANFQPQALQVKTQGQDLSKTRLWQEQEISIQGEGAMLAVQALELKAEDQVLELCAAPGGKTLQIADLKQELGYLGEHYAVEVHPGRKQHLVERLAKNNYPEIRVIEADASQAISELAGLSFTKVLADVPCSGLGQLANKPELRYTYDFLQVAGELLAKQEAILAMAASLVSVGGYVVYSTCTLDPRENEEQIKQFLATHQDFALSDLNSCFNGLLAPLKIKDLEERLAKGYFTLWPHEAHSDGFFVARLERLS